MKTSRATALKANPFLTNIQRPAHELGYLLRNLPADFLTSTPASSDALLVAQAARQHASNASVTVLSGLEAIGELIAVAASSTSNDVAATSYVNLGYLIQHLAVEAQFFSQIESDLASEIEEKKVDAAVAMTKGGGRA